MKYALTRRSGGYSLLELMMAMGLAALVVLGATGVMVYFQNKSGELSEEIEAYSDTESGRRIIMKDVKAIDPSYGLLTVLDRKGRRFFDFYPDLSEAALGGNADRELVLELGGLTEVSFLIEANDAEEIPLMIYDPALAYEVGAPPKDPTTPASLQFRSLNQNGAVADLRPNFWRDGQLLMLDTPALLRPIVAGAVSMSTAPRSPVFVGRVAGRDLPEDSLVSPLVDTTMPTDANVTGRLRIASADEFLRQLPAVGGGQPLVRLRALRMVKYTIEASSAGDGKAKGPAQIFRQAYLGNGKFGKKLLLAQGVKSLEIRRSSVGERIIYFLIRKT